MNKSIQTFGKKVVQEKPTKRKQYVQPETGAFVLNLSPLLTISYVRISDEEVDYDSEAL